MKCPTCNVLLATSEREGVEIDFCPRCWGIWLDRGELNLILRRSLPGFDLHDPLEAESQTDSGPLSSRPLAEPRQPSTDAPLSWTEVMSQTR